MSKIYGSTEYVDNPQVGDLKLEVISQWDFKTDAVCYGRIERPGGDYTVIAYALKRTTEVGDNRTKFEYVKPDKETRQQLKSMGYSLAKQDDFCSGKGKE